MIADESRRDILDCALSVARTVVLGTLAALVVNAVHLPSKHVVRSGAQTQQVNCASVPRAAQPSKKGQDPFASMLLG
jgi:hypothetical protein